MSFKHVYLEGESPYTVLLLHGTGGDENDLLQLGAAVAPHANHLSPRGKVLEGGMNRFFKRTGPGVFDEESVKGAATELTQFVKESAEQYSFDPSKVVALGYSNGANSAAAMLYLNPKSLCGAALLHGMAPLKQKMPKLNGLPVFLSGGENDSMIFPEQTRELEGLLGQNGAKLTSYWGPGGHEITAKEVAACKTWFQVEFGQA